MTAQLGSPYSCTDYTPVSYRDAAVTLWGEAGGYAHDAYRDIRDRLYPELPETLPIVIGITAYGKCLGLTRAGWEHGPRITLASNTFPLGRLYVADTVVHECLHAWLNITGQNMAHDGEDWYEAVRRLSPAVLGHELDVRRGSDRRSVRVPNPDWHEGSDAPKTLVRKERVASEHAEVARWPHPFRPDDYDRGEPIDCPTY